MIRRQMILVTSHCLNGVVTTPPSFGGRTQPTTTSLDSDGPSSQSQSQSQSLSNSDTHGSKVEVKVDEGGHGRAGQAAIPATSHASPPQYLLHLISPPAQACSNMDRQAAMAILCKPIF